jgi:hypothetical protein
VNYSSVIVNYRCRSQSIVDSIGACRNLSQHPHQSLPAGALRHTLCIACMFYQLAGMSSCHVGTSSVAVRLRVCLQCVRVQGDCRRHQISAAWSGFQIYGQLRHPVRSERHTGDRFCWSGLTRPGPKVSLVPRSPPLPLPFSHHHVQCNPPANYLRSFFSGYS